MRITELILLSFPHGKIEVLHLHWVFSNGIEEHIIYPEVKIYLFQQNKLLLFFTVSSENFISCFSSHYFDCCIKLLCYFSYHHLLKVMQLKTVKLTFSSTFVSHQSILEAALFNHWWFLGMFKVISENWRPVSPLGRVNSTSHTVFSNIFKFWK